MKLSKLTVAILTNLSTINNSIHIDEKNYLKSKTPNSSNIISVAKITEDLPEISIYSLDELLGSMSLFDQDEIEFEFTDQYIIMKSGTMKINYRLSDPAHILTKCKPATNYESYNDFDGSLKLSEENLISIQKAARILKADVVRFKLDDGKGKISLINSQLPMDNSFELNVEGEGTFLINMYVDNRLIINSNYVVNISSEKVAKFTSTDLPIFYFLSAAVLT